MTQQQIKRFYKEVDIERTAEGIEVRLDGRSVRTPMRAHLRLPTERLAREVAAEWADQTETNPIGVKNKQKKGRKERGGENGARGASAVHAQVRRAIWSGDRFISKPPATTEWE